MKLLLIRFSSLGDIIQSTALAYFIKSHYPALKLYFATKEEFAGILKDQSYIDKLFLLKDSNIKALAESIKAVDIILDLQKNPKSLMLSHLVEAKIKKTADKHSFYRRLLVVNKTLAGIFKRKTQDNIEDQFKLLGINSENALPYIEVNKQQKIHAIGMGVGAKWQTKIWPKEYYRALAHLIVKNLSFEVWLFGSKEERTIAEFVKNNNPKIVNFAGKLSISETAKKMASTIAFVSNDSALMHLGVALNIPVVAIFGSTVKEFGFAPRGRSIVLEKQLSCRPCSLHGSNSCRRGDLACMKLITPIEVFSRLLELLNDKVSYK